MDKHERALKKSGAQREKEGTCSENRHCLMPIAIKSRKINVFYLQREIRAVITMIYFMEQMHQVQLSQFQGKQERMKQYVILSCKIILN